MNGGVKISFFYTFLGLLCPTLHKQFGVELFMLLRPTYKTNTKNNRVEEHLKQNLLEQTISEMTL